MAQPACLPACLPVRTLLLTPTGRPLLLRVVCGCALQVMQQLNVTLVPVNVTFTLPTTSFSPIYEVRREPARGGTPGGRGGGTGMQAGYMHTGRYTGVKEALPRVAAHVRRWASSRSSTPGGMLAGI